MAVSAAPKAHTPPGGWHGEMPPALLEADADGPAPGIPDLRGLWKAFAVEVHGAPIPDTSDLERIEQSGNRVVITAGGVIHDMECDGTLENGVNDVSAVSYQPISVAASWEDGKLVLRPNNAFVAVTRHLEGDVLVWNLLPFGRVTRMRRVGANDV